MGVVNGSKIALSNGQLKNIIDIKNNDKVVSVDFDNTKTIVEQTGSLEKEKSQTIIITLDSELSIQGSVDSSVIIRPRSTRKPQWATLDKVKKGDNVGIVQEFPFYGEVNNDNSRVLGIMIGSGNYESMNIRLSSCDDCILNYFKKQGFDTVIVRNEDDEQGNKRRIVAVNNIDELLSKSEIMNQSKKEKTLPTDWEKYNKKTLCNLLNGLIDSDGNVFIEDNRKPVLYFTCNGEALAQEILFAFMKFGIHGKIDMRQDTYKGKRNNGRLTKPLWIVWIRGKENFSILSEEFSSMVKEKQNVLEDSKKILTKHDMKIQKNITPTDIRFEKVVEVNDGGYFETYGLSVDNYVANGIYICDK